MSNKKLLSITIPTWNRAFLLEEQLVLFTQKITDNHLEDQIEIVISDNGSDDSTEVVVKKIQATHSFISYHNNGVNRGARYNLLKALELATGKYLIFLGDDDRYKKDGLRKMIDCLNQHENLVAVFDSFGFKNNPFGNNSFISVEQLLQNFYYNIGNAGVFIIQTEVIQENVKKFGYEYFSMSWPQTQLLVLSLFQNQDKKILLTELDLFEESYHAQVMMYNSYYLLRGLYFDLADAISSIKNEISKECYNAARNYLKNNLKQTSFNILQCGVYVDDKELRKKTIDCINQNLNKYSSEEKHFLNLISFILKMPVSLSRTISDFFIFATRGKKGIAKKNKFVLQELEKIQNKANSNKSIRTFDFGT